MLGLAEQVGGDERGSEVPSAMTSTSVGPASRSIPTRPKSCRFASATYALPAPTSMSTAGMPSMRPKAIAASAWTPPRQTTSSAPEVRIAYSIAGWMPASRWGGAQATT